MKKKLIIITSETVLKEFDKNIESISVNCDIEVNDTNVMIEVICNNFSDFKFDNIEINKWAKENNSIYSEYTEELKPIIELYVKNIINKRNKNIVQLSKKDIILIK